MATTPKKNTPPDFSLIAASRDGRDITKGFLDPLLLQPNRDSILLDFGATLEVYEEVLRDDQVAAVFQQRRLAVTSAEWNVAPGGADRQSVMATDFVREQLHHIGWDAVTDKMLYGVFYGYAVAECLWARDGGRIVLDGLPVRRQRRFGFDGEGRIRLLTMQTPMGELLPERKFWHFSTGADNDDEPYGLGLAHWLYWPVLFKRGGLKMWATLLEKFGTPTAKGSYPANATREERDRLLQTLMAIQSDSAICVPDTMQVELIEATRGGTPGHGDFLARMDGAIAKVVLSQIMTSEAAGGQNKANVQKEVRNEVVRADADLINETFNRSVVRWLTEWNFPNATPPRVTRDTQEPEDLLARSQRDKNLYDMGLRPSQELVDEIYGKGWTIAPEPPQNAPVGLPTRRNNDIQGATFAEATPDTPIDRYLAEALRRFGPILREMLRSVRELAERSEGLEGLRDKIFDLYPVIDSGPLATLIQNATLVAHLAGRYEVLREIGMTGAEHAEKSPYDGVTSFSLPFKEAIDHFRGKVSVSTEHWDDLMNEQHDVGFMVAGATKADVLDDLREAVDKAIAEGTTLKEFREDFDKTVAEHGWDYFGGRDWRTRLIFETNLFNAYQAGRYRQMSDPDVLEMRPFWQYKHYPQPHPREQHAAWNGLVLPAKDPWWSTHYPPNGFRCHCTVFSLSESDVEREGLKVSGAPFDAGGVDKGFAYAPGATGMKTQGAIEEKLKILPAYLAELVKKELGMA
ncbi:hypothetical protein SIID45300_01753 [Candidatus Magnetaquicoccaceae bacterium FCR-1]|uniref:Phage head morphogenesis domain-containing protein n=1 Tax=Candidatus Magnetaquiglobus chichijimensis TaxID=3141448 RepID=A0ABQ0C9Q0_9PROT